MPQAHAEGPRSRRPVAFPGPTAAAPALTVLGRWGTGAQQLGESHVLVSFPVGSCEFGVLRTWSGTGDPVTVLHEPIISHRRNSWHLLFFPHTTETGQARRPVPRRGLQRDVLPLVQVLPTTPAPCSPSERLHRGVPGGQTCFFSRWCL